MTAYRPFELHTHTRHSDGKFLTDELLRACAAYGYYGVALTDHNAVTAADEVTPALLRETGMMVLPGIEWTTFYGHLLVLGCNRFVDWRFVTPDTIDLALEEIRAAGGVAGIAHPAEVGAPLMCGCHWEFEVTRWDLVSYVEIWSDEDPHARGKNVLALPWYDALLNEGHRLGISAGRDWHAADPDPSKPPLLTATYLGMKEDSVHSALDALREGRSYVTLGPTLDVSIAGRSLGDTVPAGPVEVCIQAGCSEREEIWRRWEIQPETVRIVNNSTVLCELPFTDEHAAVSVPVDAQPGWLRVELIGSWKGCEKPDLIALTSPIYLE
ncbi:hypothetical protein D3Z52_09195 [Clostridiaceae bacterium]|nr:hypothetical protein [Clostridiaceae bacterium]